MIKVALVGLFAIGLILLFWSLYNQIKGKYDPLYLVIAMVLLIGSTFVSAIIN